MENQKEETMLRFENGAEIRFFGTGTEEPLRSPRNPILIVEDEKEWEDEKEIN